MTVHKLYNYAPKEADVLNEGLWSPLVAPRAALAHYFGRAKTKTKKGVLAYLESTCPGRSRSISFITSPMTKRCMYYDDFVTSRTLYSVDFNALAKSGLIEGIYRSEGKKLYKIKAEDILWDEVLPWSKVRKGLFFKAIPHYMIVMKNGYVPAKFITQEK